MDAISFGCLALFAIFSIASIIVSFLGRKREVPISEFLMAGAFIDRDVSKYIRRNFIKPLRVCSYTAVGSFLAFVVYILFKYLAL